MKRLSIAVTAALALAGGLATAPAVRAAGCDQCADLPMAYRMLLDQEFLKQRFEDHQRSGFDPLSIQKMQENIVDKLNVAIKNRSLYGPLQPPENQLPTAAPAYGTDLSNASCSLNRLSKDANGNEKRTPATPADVRKSLCTPDAEFTLAHEGVHQASCRARYASGKQAELSTGRFFIEDDVAAYKAGIAALREFIAKLSKDCGWIGSTHDTKPDGTKTVPQAKDIAELATHVKSTAGALKRSSK